MGKWALLALGTGVLSATVPLVADLAVTTVAFLFGTKRNGKVLPSRPFELAVIVPAHNEEASVAHTVESLHASQATGVCPGPTRILVIAHNCSDRTADCAAEAGAEVLVYNDPAAKGKGFALRRGFDTVFSQGAQGALVIDADSTVSAGLLDEVRGALASGANVVQCRYEMRSPAGSPKSRLAALALRGFNLVRPVGRSRMGLSAGILGNGFAISRELSAAVPYRALSIVEDLEYHLHLVQAGQRVVFLEHARVLADLPPTESGETTQRSRWEGGRLRVARKMLGPLASQIIRGRTEQIEPFLDLAGLPIAYGTALLLLGICLPLAWLRWYCAAALLILAGHVIVAAASGDDVWAEVRLLAAAPVYILWKLRLMPRLLRASGLNAVWIRTERAAANRRI